MSSDLPSDAAVRQTIDWRGADWYLPARAANDRQRASHDAAVGVLEEHEATGKPFALSLRFFKMRQLLEYPDGGRGQILALDLRDRLRTRGASLIRVQDTDDAGRVIDEMSHEVPSLLLDDARWFEVVTALIRRAEMIVAEVPGLGMGLSAELKACVDLGRVDRTVLVVASSPDIEYAGNEAAVQPFYRMMLTQELDGESPSRSLVFRDLLARIGRISRLSAAERVSALRQGTFDQLAPIAPRGLAAGLMRVAEQYAHLQAAGGTFSAGMRAAKAAAAASSPVHAVRCLMRTADLCEAAGHAMLALTVLDDAEKARRDLGTSVGTAVQGRLGASIQRRYHLLLGRLFETMMKDGQAEELWRLARSRASHAIEHQTPAIMAQCFGWMAAAAVSGGRYDLAREHANDAIMVARSCRHRFYEGFASVYLGHAERRSGRLEDAARAYAAAIELLGGRKPPNILAVAMLSMAQVGEQLGQHASALQLYTSAREMAGAMKLADIEAAAADGERRLAG
jgi:tetratricopeptide (TPR) repeat protein